MTFFDHFLNIFHALGGFFLIVIMGVIMVFAFVYALYSLVCAALGVRLYEENARMMEVSISWKQRLVRLGLATVCVFAGFLVCALIAQYHEYWA